VGKVLAVLLLLLRLLLLLLLLVRLLLLVLLLDGEAAMIQASQKHWNVTRSTAKRRRILDFIVVDVLVVGGFSWSFVVYQYMEMLFVMFLILA
jgi:hypothetical protein